MKVLVLGGDGFLGSHFVDKVVELGHEVSVFDRFPLMLTRNLEHLRHNVRLINGEFENRNQLRDALAGQEVVYHFIGATNPHLSWNDPFIEIDLSVKRSVHMFELAAELGVRKVVYPSSGGTVYGRQPQPATEETPPMPYSPYGIAKVAIEHFLDYYREREGLAFDIYRIGNPYGPRQPTGSVQGVIALWMEAILNGEEILVFGDRQNIRDYVYVRDVAELMTHSLTDLDTSEIFNLGTGEGLSVLDLLEIFKEGLDVEFDYRILEKRPSDNASSILDSSKLTSHFPGFEFKRFREMIGETFDDVRSRFRK